MVKTRFERNEEREALRFCLEELEFVGLKGQETQVSCNLSYGNQRLLEVARALATQPRLLILDEPAGGMNETGNRGSHRSDWKIERERPDHSSYRTRYELGYAGLRTPCGPGIRLQDCRRDTGKY